MPPRAVRHGMLLGVLLIIATLVAGQAADEADDAEMIDRVGALLRDPQRTDEGILLLNEAITKYPQSARLLLIRAGILEDRRQWKESLADYDRAVELAAEQFDVWHRRGGARFKSGDVRGSIDDFDRAIQLNPSLERRHWQRGLSYYYDEQFAAGAKQFALYQTYHASDVENVVWKFLCQAKVDGIEKARADMMTLDGKDPRVPLMEVDALYRGKLEPEQVMVAARAGSPNADDLKYRMFYGHLYVGLYYEAIGNGAEGRKHMLEADKLQNDHYMWDVAHLHVSRYKK